MWHSRPVMDQDILSSVAHWKIWSSTFASVAWMQWIMPLVCLCFHTRHVRHTHTHYFSCYCIQILLNIFFLAIMCIHGAAEWTCRGWQKETNYLRFPIMLRWHIRRVTLSHVEDSVGKLFIFQVSFEQFIEFYCWCIKFKSANNILKEKQTRDFWIVMEIYWDWNINFESREN